MQYLCKLIKMEENEIIKFLIKVQPFTPHIPRLPNPYYRKLINLSTSKEIEQIEN